MVPFLKGESRLRRLHATPNFSLCFRSGRTGRCRARRRNAPSKAWRHPETDIGKTGEQLTIIGQAGGRFPMCSYEDAKAITLRAYELGVNYFDNARIYWDGRSEEVYGDVLPPFRKNIFLTTKSPQRSRQGAEADLDKSLRALKTDYVDLWQIHQVSTMDEVEQIFAPGGAIEAFDAAKKAGQVPLYRLHGPS